LLELYPNVYQIKVPIRNNPLGYINSYLIKTDEGCILIDSGWNTEDAFEALRDGVHETGASFEDIRYLIVTHIHPDHYGLVGRLQEYTDADVVLHETERQLLDSRYTDYKKLMAASENWLRVNGAPSKDRVLLQNASLEILGFVAASLPNHPVYGGELLRLGEVSLEVLWTPGHSPGHICLYDRERRLLFSGDHVLERITSNVSMNVQTQSNPLVDYQHALRQLEGLEVDLILPGHGNPFTGLQERIKDILDHHEDRLAEMRALCAHGPKTAYEIARGTKWFMAWDDLPPFSQRTAVTETLSHLELLLSRGLLQKTIRDGVFHYQSS
jgi:glyoxylase-like metal-dependent hydrolase (beta-lactamase superfamily II)